ncbi:sensor histidine kinase [Streptomyces sp. NPDC002446]
MVQKEAPNRAPAAAVFGWLIPVAGTVAAAVLAVCLASDPARSAAVWIGATAVVAVAGTAVAAARRSRLVDALQETTAAQTRVMARQQDLTVWLADELLPEMLQRLRQDEGPEEVLNAFTSRWAQSYAGLPPDFQAAHRSLLRTVFDAVDAEEGLRDSAQRSLVNLARRVQAIVHRQASELREMEDRHGRQPEVFGDLLRLDHGTALIGRLADSIAVLGGERPGRQWSRPVALYSVLRGAMSRIVGYERVELSPTMDIAVVGPAVEPLIHAVAELLDNAIRYSPPNTRVHLTATEVNSGIAVEVEDAGLGMGEPARRRAEHVLAKAQQGIDLSDLGESPRLGLNVVGRLSQAYGFQVSLRSSAYGGVRAILVVPQQLITTVAEASGVAHGIGTFSGPRVAKTQRTVPSQFDTAPFTEPHDEMPTAVGRTANGLPQRRRKSRLTAPQPPTGSARRTEPDPQSPPGEWLVAFKGLRGDGEGRGETPGPSKGEQ